MDARPTDNRQTIHHCMLHGLQTGVFPGAVLWVALGGREYFHRAYGVIDGFSREPVSAATLFDLASLTKPLATTLAMMHLVGQGRIALDMPLGRLMPEFEDRPPGKATVEQLLRHQGGWAAYLPLYKTLKAETADARRRELRGRLAAMEPVYPPGRQTLYSDLGFMVLDWVVERWAGQALDGLVADHYYSPLKIADLYFPGLGHPVSRQRFAATEDCPWRRRVLQGEVHDENAFAVGGVAGHAGLFGTARAVGRLLKEISAAWRGPTARGIFHGPLVRRFLNHPAPLKRPLGFDCPAVRDSSAGRHFGSDSVGHLGFTGTSFWMDLERDVTVVLLTNRVHPRRSNQRIRRFRPVLHDCIMEALGGFG